MRGEAHDQPNTFIGVEEAGAAARVREDEGDNLVLGLVGARARDQVVQLRDGVVAELVLRVEGLDLAAKLVPRHATIRDSGRRGGRDRSRARKRRPRRQRRSRWRWHVEVAKVVPVLQRRRGPDGGAVVLRRRPGALERRGHLGRPPPEAQWAADLLGRGLKAPRRRLHLDVGRDVPHLDGANRASSGCDGRSTVDLDKGYSSIVRCAQAPEERHVVAGAALAAAGEERAELGDIRLRRVELLFLGDDLGAGISPFCRSVSGARIRASHTSFKTSSVGVKLGPNGNLRRRTRGVRDVESTPGAAPPDGMLWHLRARVLAERVRARRFGPLASARALRLLCARVLASARLDGALRLHARSLFFLRRRDVRRRRGALLPGLLLLLRSGAWFRRSVAFPLLASGRRGARYAAQPSWRQGGC
mmetsp:Transcript_23026/g.78745  ORF Transcript_23026/g.78745 Transcript_23026/m.78745 type:complete len:418 (+) Transcript_23026:1035-2288(+)